MPKKKYNCLVCGEIRQLHRYGVCPSCKRASNEDGSKKVNINSTEGTCQGCGQTCRLRHFPRALPFCRLCVDIHEPKKPPRPKSEKQVLKAGLQKALKRSKGGAKSRGIGFFLDISDILTLWDQQDGKCFMSGVPMSFTTHSTELVTIDRINNGRGYVVGNVVLSCKVVNIGRNSLAITDYVDWCTKVATYAGTLDLAKFHDDGTTEAP